MYTGSLSEQKAELGGNSGLRASAPDHSTVLPLCCWAHSGCLLSATVCWAHFPPLYPPSRYPPTHPFIYAPTYPPIHLSTCLSFHPPIYPPTHSSTCMSTTHSPIYRLLYHLSTHPHTYLSACIFTHSPNHLNVYLSIPHTSHLPLCPPTHTSTYTSTYPIHPSAIR